jgi:hypothetical protein
VQSNLARRLWLRLEAYHAVVYFAPEKKPAYDDAGLKGGWMGYFAARAAPLGAPSAELVTALFYNFHLRMVRRSIPDAWTFSTPERVLEARRRVVDGALRRLLGDGVASEALARAAAICTEAAESCDPAGRPMFAANAALDPPGEPHLRLWHAVTMVREHRGDGHVAALVSGGLDGCEAHVALAATGEVPRSELQPNRGWSDDDWADAQDRLRRRGLVDENGLLTREGRELRDWVEDRTDELAVAPWRSIGAEKSERLLTLLEGPVRLVLDGGGVPFPNPMGLPDARV